MKKLLLVFAVLGFTINAASKAVMYEIKNTAFFDSIPVPARFVVFNY